MELHPGRDGPAVAVGQVVQHDWPVAGSGQLPDTVAADITRTADDQDVHGVKLVLPSVR